MSIWIEKDEATAARRRVPCRIFLSNGTAPDTGALNDAIVIGTNSLTTASATSTLREVNANQGMYCLEMTAAEVATLGTYCLYHTVGDFPQHIATVQVVNSNPMSFLSAYDPKEVWNASRSSFTGPKTMGMTNQLISSLTCANVGDANHIRLSSAESTQDDVYNGMAISVMMRSGFWQSNVISDYTGSNNSAWCRSSWLSIPRSGDTYVIWPQVSWNNVSVQTIYASASTASSYLAPINHSGASVEVKTGGIQTTSIGVGNYSGVSVEVKTGGIQVASIAAGAYSGRSFEVTTGGIQVVSMGKGNYSGVSMEVLTGGIQTTSVGKGNYSGVSVEILTGGIQTTSVGKGSYSGVSVEVATGGIQTTSVGKGNYSGVSVEVKTKGIAVASIETVAIYSALTFGGVDNITPRSYSGVSVEVKTGGIQPASVGVGNYSGMSVEVKAKGIAVASIETVAIYSALTFGGVDNITPRSYSGVSVEVKTGGIQVASIGVGSYSGVSVEVKASGLVAGSIGAAAITSAKFGASAIDAAALATDATVEIADALLGRNIAGGSTGGRTVSEALYPLRNRTAIEASVLTVYLVDDATSSWTATVSTGTLPIAGIDPLGP